MTTITTTPLPDMLTEEELPLYVTALPDGYEYGHEINVCPEAENDKLLLHNALSGSIITSKIYPLIWNGNQKFRSLGYLQALEASDVELLSDDELTLVGASLRDLAFMHITSKDKSEFGGLIEKSSQGITNNQAGSFLICGLRATPWPTRINKCIRWLDLPREDEAFEDFFLRGKDGLILAFCDPHDLSYHNVENVVNMERLFPEGSKLKIASVQELCGESERAVFTFQLDQTTNLFADLLYWNSYTPPFNSDQRGGDRFIFRSKRLSNAITEALKQQHALDCLGFDYVNTVFRLNRFEPGDDKFQSHYDIPFYDSLKQQRSKYTLLLYLTQGQAAEGQSVLRIGQDHHVDRVQSLQGVIFGHEYEHEGNPFADTSKIFLRSELVCDIQGEECFDPQICKLFNIACHTALFHPELKEYATQLFNHSVACRFQPTLLPTCTPIYIHHFKEVNGISYITNGHDYWFRGQNLKEAAIVSLLDYFDGSYKSQTFRSMRKVCYPIDDELCDPLDDEEMVSILERKAGGCTAQKTPTEELVGYDLLDKKPLPNCGCCCEYACFHENHCGFLNSTHHVDHFNSACFRARKELEEGSVAIFEGTMRIHTEDMIVTESEILFKTTGQQERIFFASCCNRDYPDLRPFTYEQMETELFHVPPIRYREIYDGGGYHLVIDMFENGWTNSKTVEFPVPKKKVPRPYQVVDK